jgi:uncharacterized membrane protein YhaH (DUF805 family)
MFMPLRRYVDFTGRSCRKEFWLFFLLQFIAVALLAVWLFRALIIVGQLGDTGHVVDEFAGYLGPGLQWFAAFVLVTMLPFTAVQVRRFHDQDMSGWLVLLNFVPAVGGFIVLVFMCLKGTSGENRYGPDPLAAA